MVIIMTVRLVGRAVDRKGKIALSCCKRENFIWGYKYPPIKLVFNKFFKSKSSHSFLCLTASFQKSFWV